MRRAIAALVLVGSTFLVAPAFGQSRTDLEKARAAYLARNYTEAEERLRALVDPRAGFKERALLSQARMNLGAVLLAQGKKDAAGDVFEKLILEDPAFEPDPLGFPGDVINTFIDVRASLQERIKLAVQEAAHREAERKAREEAEKRAREKYLHDLEVQAAEEEVTVKNQRLVALIPFGVGQFQNRQYVLGWILLGTEAALALGTVITVPMYVYARDRAKEELARKDEATSDAYKERADDIWYANRGLALGLGVVAAVGIVQANVAFVPQVSDKKKRDLPKMQVSRIGPIVAPLMSREGAPAGAFVGIAGTTF